MDLMIYASNNHLFSAESGILGSKMLSCIFADEPSTKEDTESNNGVQ